MVSLAVDGLSVTRGRRMVVRDVSLTLADGMLVGILGPNGAGKSTLVRALLGLTPAAQGQVMLDGAAIDALPRAEVAQRIAYLPQGQTLHWPLTVERLVALGRLPHLAPFSRSGPVDRAAIADAMARAEVTHLAARTATELSGGERARVLLARALAVGAPALVADEPLASLDPEHQLHGMEVMRELARGGGLVLAVLHDLPLAARFCDRVLVMDAGRLVADGPPQEVLTPALMAQVYRVRVAPGTLLPIERLPVAE